MSTEWLAIQKPENLKPKLEKLNKTFPFFFFRKSYFSMGTMGGPEVFVSSVKRILWKNQNISDKKSLHHKFNLKWLNML